MFTLHLTEKIDAEGPLTVAHATGPGLPDRGLRIAVRGDRAVLPRAARRIIDAGGDPLAPLVAVRDGCEVYCQRLAAVRWAIMDVMDSDRDGLRSRRAVRASRRVLAAARAAGLDVRGITVHPPAERLAES